MVIGEQLIVIIWHIEDYCCVSQIEGWLTVEGFSTSITSFLVCVNVIWGLYPLSIFLLSSESWFLAKGYQTFISFSVFSLCDFSNDEWVFIAGTKFSYFYYIPRIFSVLRVFWELSALGISYIHYPYRVFLLGEFCDLQWNLYSGQKTIHIKYIPRICLLCKFSDV